MIKIKKVLYSIAEILRQHKDIKINTVNANDENFLIGWMKSDDVYYVKLHKRKASYDQ